MHYCAGVESAPPGSTPAKPVSVALIGGTGKLGSALAARFAQAGHEVVLGSRDPARAAHAAAELRRSGGYERVSGLDNRGAAAACDIVVITVPFDGQAAILADIESATDGRVVVSTAVPVSFSGGTPAHVDVAEGSATEQVARLLPRARVVGARHTVSSAVRSRLQRGLDADVLVTGDDVAAKSAVAALLAGIEGARAVDAGALRNSRHVEQLTVLLLTINSRSRRHTGVRITDLPDDLAWPGPAPG